MATKLKGLQITSTDLVPQGANPDAHIRLFKRRDTPDEDSQQPQTLLQKAGAALLGLCEKAMEAVSKESTTFADELNRAQLRDVCGEAWDYSYALIDSLCSIISDGELAEDDKRGMMNTSMDEFAVTMRAAIPKWAAGSKAEGTAQVQKSAGQQAAFDGLLEKYAPAEPESGGGASFGKPESEPSGDLVDKSNTISTQKEEMNTMNIDKSKMTPEERATLEDFEKKYGAADPAPSAPIELNPSDGVAKDANGGSNVIPELHPDVKKALDANKALSAKVEELQKSLEIERLTGIAKKYEVIGKKADELAPKLYDLRKAGGTAYDDTIALLDEQVVLVEKSGLFSEYGRNTSGSPDTADQISIKAAEVAKIGSGLTGAAAIAKAYEDNPELAQQYENQYRGRV